MPNKIEEERTLLDKTAWGDGPWQREPDFVRFRHLGLPCLVTRQPQSGHLCGYVAVPPGHPWHGKNYDACDGADVHGGLTYARPCEGDICHVPPPGESDDVWWLGFDCSHSGDYRPAKGVVPSGSLRQLQELVAHLNGRRDWGTYRDLPYVVSEVTQLADQARSAQGWTKHL